MASEIQIRISDEKKTQFKAICEANRTTMADIIKQAVDDYINQNLKGDK